MPNAKSFVNYEGPSGDLLELQLVSRQQGSVPLEKWRLWMVGFLPLYHAGVPTLPKHLLLWTPSPKSLGISQSATLATTMFQKPQRRSLED